MQLSSQQNEKSHCAPYLFRDLQREDLLALRSHVFPHNYYDGQTQNRARGLDYKVAQ